jgi:hypothetical protein
VVARLWPLLLYAGLALLFTFWNMWWARQAVEQGHSPFETPLMHYPFGLSLSFHTHNLLNSLLTLPIQVCGGIPAAFNLAVLLAFFLPSVFHPLWGAAVGEFFYGRLTPSYVVGGIVMLGYVPLALALLGALRERRRAGLFVLVFATFFVLALGPHLKVGGINTYDTALPVPLPYWTLAPRQWYDGQANEQGVYYRWARGTEGALLLYPCGQRRAEVALPPGTLRRLHLLLPLHEGENRLYLRSLEPATSPTAEGFADDARLLSFNVSAIEVRGHR